MDSLRNEYSSFQDPMMVYTSLGGNMETPFVASDFSEDRRGSLFSAGSGAGLSFGSTPTEIGSIPSTPVGDSRRPHGAMTPAELMLTPESPCPPSWRSYVGRQPVFAVGGAPQSRYSTSFQDLTRNMATASLPQDYTQQSSSPSIFGRELSCQDLDPIQTSFGGVPFPVYFNDVSPAESFSSSSSTAAKSWDDDLSSGYLSPKRDLHFTPTTAKVRKPRTTKPRDRRVLKTAPYNCTNPECHGKRFARKEHLRRHENSKHRERRYECLQGRILGKHFCQKLMGHRPISRSDNVNQHSCTHVINGMGKTRNSLCELLVAEACIKDDVHKEADFEKAQKQCAALREHMDKIAKESDVKGIKTARPQPNAHISHELMMKLGFDCTNGCPMGPRHVFDGEWGPLCDAFVGNPSEPRTNSIIELDGDVSPDPELGQAQPAPRSRL